MYTCTCTCRPKQPDHTLLNFQVYVGFSAAAIIYTCTCIERLLYMYMYDKRLCCCTKLCLSLETYNFRNEIKRPPETAGDDGRASDYVPYEDTMALTKWRQAISAATSSSQLAVCVNQLERCIAWEKSPMKVVCTLQYLYANRQTFEERSMKSSLNGNPINPNCRK